MAGRDLLARPSVREVLVRVSAGGVLTPAAEEAARAALTRMTSGQMPWFLRVLIGAGAWIGASFLLSAILSLILLASGEQMNSAAIVIGIVFIAGSIPFRQRVTSPFLTQLALVVSSTGQILVIGGVGAEGSSVLAGSIAAIITSLVLIVGFPDRVQRFSATLVIFGALTVIVIEYKIPHGMEALALLAIALMVGLWRFTPRALVEAHAALVEPMVYGLAIVVIGILITHSAILLGEIFEMRWATLGIAAIAGFNIALLAMTVSIFLEHDVPLTRPDALGALAGLVLLGAITRSTPGVVTTLLMLVLGFDRRARGLIALAVTFFLAFGAAFYYDLRITLLQKSGILVLSGAVCLAAWAVVRAREPRP
jgi:hypothetical protein